MSNTTTPSPGDSTSSRPLLSPYYRHRILVISAAVLCFCAFWWVARLMSIPRHPGYEANLFQQPSPGAAVLMTALVLIGCALGGSLIARSVQPEAGLLAACAGLSAMSVRGGTLHDVLFYAQSPTVYLAMAGEVVVLLALVVLAWQISDRIFARPAAGDAAGAARRISAADLALATASQFAFTSALLIALAQSDAKHQVLAAVGIAGFSASLITYYLFRVKFSACYWIGTVLAGFFGYAMTYLRPLGWEIGEAQAPLLSRMPAMVFVAALAVYEWFMRRWIRETQRPHKPKKPAGPEPQISSTAHAVGWLCIAPILVFLVAANWLFMDNSQNLFASLARPLPLDYASAGPVGAILGFWAAREWAENAESASDGSAH